MGDESKHGEMHCACRNYASEESQWTSRHGDLIGALLYKQWMGLLPSDSDLHHPNCAVQQRRVVLSLRYLEEISEDVELTREEVASLAADDVDNIVGREANRRKALAVACRGELAKSPYGKYLFLMVEQPSMAGFWDLDQIECNYPIAVSPELAALISGAPRMLQALVSADDSFRCLGIDAEDYPRESIRKIVAEIVGPEVALDALGKG